MLTPDVEDDSFIELLFVKLTEVLLFLCWVRSGSCDAIFTGVENVPSVTAF